MKKVFYLIVLFSSIVFSQVPQGISHRGTVYDITGALVSGHLVKIKTSILEGTTIVYSETHTLMTNSTGQYSLNIGTSTTLNPPNVLFNTINWGNGINKELKVEIDPTGTGTSFPIIGQNQLMSVPYALYSMNSQTTSANNSLRILNNINELRNVVGNFGDVIYIKGHTTQGDGGGGNFIWRNDINLLSSTLPHSVFSEDNDGTIIQAKNTDGSFNDSGRWIRQFNGYIDVRYFGVTYSNSTQKLQNAINYAYYTANLDNSPTRGSTIFFPSGSYIIDKLLLRNGVSLIGDSSNSTIIYATIPTDQDYTSEDYMFKMENGVIEISISNLNIVGRDTSKGCFYFDAQLDSGNIQGGLWYSSFKNIKITGFNGTGLYLKGGKSGLTPNQLLTFEKVIIKRKNDNSFCMKVEGQAGQITFLNCAFSGTKNSSGKRNLGSDVILQNDEKVTSAVLSFINSTFDDSEIGINIDYAENITIDNCWFENLGTAIQVDGTDHPCKSINIINNRFANASGFGSISSPGNNLSAGKCVNIINSFVNILNNFVTVSDANNPQVNDDYFVVGSNYTNEGINIQGNSFSSPILGRTTEMMSVIASISSNVLNCKKNKIVFVNSSSTATPSTTIIKSIDSDFNTSETIFIRANGGTVSFWDINKSTSPLNTHPNKNIFLSMTATAAPNGVLTLKNGEVAIFTRIDSIYQLTSIIRGNTP